MKARPLSVTGGLLLAGCALDPPVELYDLVRDPNEITDVGADHQDIVARLRAVMESRTESQVERWNFAR